MLDIQDYITQMAVGMTDNKTLYESKWGKVKNYKRIKSSIKDLGNVTFKITEDDLP